MSDYACNTLISQCNAFTADPDQHYLIQTFDHKIDAMSELMEEQKTLYKEKNAALVREHVLPAYTHLPLRSQSFSAAAKTIWVSATSQTEKITTVTWSATTPGALPIFRRCRTGS